VDLRGAGWRKSSRSSNNGGVCVELARVGGVVAVRDSKNPEAPALVFGTREMRSFIEGIKKA
jgi:hypothetical protein